MKPDPSLARINSRICSTLGCISAAECALRRNKEISNGATILVLDKKKCAISAPYTNCIVECFRGNEADLRIAAGLHCVKKDCQSFFCVELNFHSQPGQEVRHSWSAWEVQQSSEQLYAAPCSFYQRVWCQAARLGNHTRLYNMSVVNLILPHVVLWIYGCNKISRFSPISISSLRS